MNSKILSLALLCLLMLNFSAKGQYTQKHRVIILSDIEADPDDTQSFVRLFLYANEIDIQGIVATTSCWMRNRVEPESIRRIIRAYGKVQANLNVHHKGFPDEETLLGLVKQGLPIYGMEGVGEGKDSEGSDWIIKMLKEDDDRPLWVSVWGGVNTLAQALYTIDKTHSKAEAKKLISKLRVYTISDQDDSGIWIRNNFPDLFYIVSPGDDYGSATWNAINSVIDGINNETISNKWLAENIQQGHGPLGAIYPDVAWGMEGDTPSWLNLILNGLSNPEHPEWGGWGGRYELYKPEFKKGNTTNSGVPIEAETRTIWTDAQETYSHYIYKDYGRAVKASDTKFSGNKVSLWRWRDDFQNDFAARIDWCTKTFEEANHAPVILLNNPTEITLQSGQYIRLDALESSDPDGDNLSFLWFSYPEAGSYKKTISFVPENSHLVNFTAPKVDQKETIHIILKLTDKGVPQLSSYKRIIITVLPE